VTEHWAISRGANEALGWTTGRCSQGGIILRPAAVGLCGTDRDIMAGTRSDSAAILGHEVVGEVVSLGGSSASLVLGSLVIVGSVNPVDQDDIIGHSRPGALQHCLSLSSGFESVILPVPSGLDPLLAVLAEPLASALYAWEAMDAACAVASRLAILGGGSMGLLLATVARIRGQAATVVTSAARGPWLVEQGCLDVAEWTSIDEARDETLDGAFDGVFVCSRRSDADRSATLASRLVAPGGAIDFVSAWPDGPPEASAIRRENACGQPSTPAFAAITLGTKTIRATGHRGVARRHLERALILLSTYPGQFQRLVSRILAPREFVSLPPERRWPAYGTKTVVSIRRQ